MPMTYTCTDHPTWHGDVLGQAKAHAENDHGDAFSALRDRGVLVSAYESQLAAQARLRGERPVNWRRFGCRRCGVPVETTDDDRAPYCDDCLPEGSIR